MRASLSQILFKAFGYGIYLVELTPPPEKKIRPNGQKDVQETEIFKRLQKSGLNLSEVVLDAEDESRAFVMGPDGHEPTRYELSLIDNEDWERIRTSVDFWGSQGFSNRLTMLEGHKPASVTHATPP